MTFAMTASCRLAAALATFMIFAPLVPQAARAASDFAPGSSVTVVTGETLPVRSEPNWSAAAASEVAPGVWLGVVSGPHYDADGTPWYEVDAGGFVPASALGGGASAPSEAEVAYQPEGKEASYAAAQETGEAAPVEVAADVAPVEVASDVAPTEALEADPLAETGAAPAVATYDPTAVVATAWIAGTNGDGAACRAGADWAAAEAGWLAEGAPVGVLGDPVGEWQPVACGGGAGFVHASFVAWEPPATVDAGGGDGAGVAADLETAPAADPAVTTSEAAVAEAAQRGRRGDDGSGGNDPSDDGNNGNDASDGNGGGGGSGQAVADFAMRYEGYPYVWGAAGPDAFDCSGFTMYVYKQALGLDISHDLFAQFDAGQQVDRDDLQPGDMVFFQNTYRPGLSHNGIYIGGGMMIHAENETTGVKVSDINSEYYGSRWYGAVRLA